jgi:hypothetical protein
MTSSDELGSQRNAAKRLEPYRAEITEWRQTMSADDVALKHEAPSWASAITVMPIYRACARWGVGPERDLRVGNGGRQPKSGDTLRSIARYYWPTRQRARATYAAIAWQSAATASRSASGVQWSRAPLSGRLAWGG